MWITYALDVIDDLPQNIHDLSNEDEFLTVLTKSLDNAELQKERYQINAELLEEIQLEDPGASWSRANDYKQRRWLGGNPTFLGKYLFNFAFIFHYFYLFACIRDNAWIKWGGASCV